MNTNRKGQLVDRVGNVEVAGFRDGQCLERIVVVGQVRNPGQDGRNRVCVRIQPSQVRGAVVTRPTKHAERLLHACAPTFVEEESAEEHVKQVQQRRQHRRDAALRDERAHKSMKRRGFAATPRRKPWSVRSHSN